MKILRVPLMLLCLATSAQTPEPNDVVRRAHAAYNAFADLANQWTQKHDDLIWNVADNERLVKADQAWKRFEGLAREAGLLETKKRGK